MWCCVVLRYVATVCGCGDVGMGAGGVRVGVCVGEGVCVGVGVGVLPWNNTHITTGYMH